MNTNNEETLTYKIKNSLKWYVETRCKSYKKPSLLAILLLIEILMVYGAHNKNIFSIDIYVALYLLLPIAFAYGNPVIKLDALEKLGNSCTLVISSLKGQLLLIVNLILFITIYASSLTLIYNDIFIGYLVFFSFFVFRISFFLLVNTLNNQ